MSGLGGKVLIKICTGGKTTALPHRCGCDFLQRLVGELEILLDVDGVFDLEENDGQGDQHAATQETPVDREDGHEGDLVVVDSVELEGDG